MTLYRFIRQMAGLSIDDPETHMDATQQRAALVTLLCAVVAETKYATHDFVAPLVADYLRLRPESQRASPNTNQCALHAVDSRQAAIELRRKLSEFDKLYLLTKLWALARSDQMESFYETIYIRTAADLLGARYETYLEAKRLGLETKVVEVPISR